MTSVVRFEEWQEPTGTTAATVDGSGNVAFSGTITQGGVLMPTATELNAIGTWQAFTPGVFQNGAVAHTVNVARYTKINDLIVAQLKITVTGTGTAGQPLAVTNLPTAAYGQIIIGNGALYDSSTAVMYSGWLYSASLTDVYFVGDWAANGVWGTVPSLAVAANDTIYMLLSYEAA